MRASLYGLMLWSATLACPAQSKHYLIEETTVASGAKTQFEAAQKSYCEAVVRGGAPSCLVLAPTTFSKANRYLTLLSFGTFAHYDEGTYTSKGLTAEQAKELSARRAPAIASNEESGIQLLYPETPNHDDASPIVLITEVHVLPGRANAFVTLMRDKVIPAASRKGRPEVEIYQTEANGDPDRLFLLQHLAKFGDLDAANPLWSAIPPAARPAFDDSFAKCVRSSFVTVMHFRQDLSAFSR